MRQKRLNVKLQRHLLQNVSVNRLLAASPLHTVMAHVEEEEKNRSELTEPAAEQRGT